MPKYVIRKKTVEGLEQTLEDLEDQERLFDLEQEIKQKQITFREKVLNQLDEDIVLDDIFEQMAENGLCRKISVWVTTDI